MSLTGPRVITGRRKLLKATLIGVSGQFQRVRHQGAGAADVVLTAVGSARRQLRASGQALLALFASGTSQAPTKSGAGSASLSLAATGAAFARRAGAGAAALLTGAGGGAIVRRPTTGSAAMLTAASGSAVARRFATGSAMLTTLGTGGGSAPSYLGQMATRTFDMDSALASASATKQSGRTAHYAFEPIVDPIVVYPNFSAPATNVETGISGGTAKCALELTLGTRAAQNDGGAVSFSNGFAVCRFTGITIPVGWFWLDYYVDSPNGIAFFQRGYGASIASPWEGWVFGTGAITDYTAGGTPPNGNLQSQGYGPVLILGQTKKPSVLMLGTSKSHGVHDLQDAVGNKGYARLIGSQFPYTSLARPSSLLAAFMSDTRFYRNQILNGTIDGINTGVPYHSHMINYDMINDLQSGGDSAAVAAGRLASLNAAFPKHKHIDVTNTPKATSTDNFITIPNQTVDAIGLKSQALNDLIRSGIAGSAGFIDLSDLLDASRTGKWPVSANPADTSCPSASFTGVQSNTNTLTVSAVTGTIEIGMVVHGSGVSAGAVIVAQTSGTAGGAGNYTILTKQTLTSRAMTADSKITGDGLHEAILAYELIVARSGSSLAVIKR